MPHGSVDNQATRGNHGSRLLSLQHGRGNFRRIGQVADSSFDNLDTGFVQSILNVTFQLIADRLRVST